MASDGVEDARQFTWIHVSDFHFKAGDAYERDKVLDSLVEGVQRFCSEHPPDAVFVSGDIANSGDDGEYACATPQFEKLLVATGLDKDRLFVAPGNHDAKLNRYLCRSLSSERDSVEYFAPGSPVPHFDQFSAFVEWHNEFFRGVREYEANTTCQAPAVIDVRGLRVGVMSVNSALFTRDDDQDHGKLWIGRRCLDERMEELERLDLDVRIALTHHPLDWLHDAERTNIKAQLYREFDLVLRGHLHDPEAEQCVTAQSAALLVASGACYQTRQWPNRCLFARAQIEDQSVRVLPLHYIDSPAEKWDLDTALWDRDDDYCGVFPVQWKCGSRAVESPRDDEAEGDAPSGEPGAPAGSPAPTVRMAKEHIGRDYAEHLHSLANTWMADGPAVCFLEGFSGVGKSTLALDLVRNVAVPTPTPVEVTEHESDPVDDLLLELAQELSLVGHQAMADAVDSGRDLMAALEEELRQPILIVIDEFQRALVEDTGRPVKGLMRLIERLSRRPSMPGRLLLLTHQSVERDRWSESCEIRRLSGPDADEAEQMLVALLDREDRRDEVPQERRRDVVNWLGRNPRALRVFAAALREDSLNDLLGLAPELWEAQDRVVSPHLLRRLEEQLLSRMLTRMPPASKSFLLSLAVHRKPFKKHAMEALAQGDELSAFRRDLTDRFLMEHRRGWYSLNPIVREIALHRLGEAPRRLRRAHSIAGDHHARHFGARQMTGGGRLGAHLVEARYHLVKSGREDELAAIAVRFTSHVMSWAHSTAPIPATQRELEERIAVLVGICEKGGPKGIQYYLARLFQARGKPGDEREALAYARRAAGPRAPAQTWVLRIRLEAAVHGLDQAVAATRDGVDCVPVDKNLFTLYQACGELLGEADRVDEAVALLKEGIRAIPPDNNRFALYQASGGLLGQAGRVGEAVALLKEGIRAIPPNKNLFVLYETCGRLLARTGSVSEAIALLREGIHAIPAGRYNRHRLEHYAMLYCVAASDHDVLDELLGGTGADALSPASVAFGEVLRLEMAGDWPGAAARAHGGAEASRTSWLCEHEAFSQLCAGSPDVAEATLRRYRLTVHIRRNRALAWVVAFTQLRNGNMDAARGALSAYYDRPLLDGEEPSEDLLLALWDAPQEQDELNGPAFVFPVVGPSLTGLSQPVARPPHGPAILPGLRGAEPSGTTTANG